jgi:hypothetical protein
LATLGGAILTETSRSQNTEDRTEIDAQTFFDVLVHCAHIYKIEFWYKILEFKKKMPRRLLKVGTKRLILTCFETFIEANGKTTHKNEHHQ